MLLLCCVLQNGIIGGQLCFRYSVSFIWECGSTSCMLKYLGSACFLVRLRVSCHLSFSCILFVSATSCFRNSTSKLSLQISRHNHIAGAAKFSSLSFRAKLQDTKGLWNLAAQVQNHYHHQITSLTAIPKDESGAQVNQTPSSIILFMLILHVHLAPF